MRKYNLSEIMKRAWNIFKNKSITFAAALKESWKISKEELQRKDLLFKNKDFYGVKDWFLHKTLTEQERYAFKTGCAYITKETEKAVLIKCDTKYGDLSFWCPKKCLKTENEKEELVKRFESGLKYNELLVSFAKKHGVKGVRKGFRTQTIIEKIQEAGLEVPARV